MVSTHQQYLCPDYLSPLPSTLDSNKSPLALLAQTCNSIGLPEPQTSKGKTNNAETNSTKTDKNAKDDTKGCKTSSSQADSTSDGVEFGKGKDSPTTEKKSTDIRQTNSSNEETNKNDANSVTSSNAVGTESTTADTKLSGIHHPTTTVSMPTALASTSKCGGTCVTPGYPPHLFSHYFPPTSAPAFPYSHSAVPSLPLSCYPGFQMSNMPMFPRLCTDPFCKSCPPNQTIPSLAASSFGGSGRTCPLGCTQCTSHPADLSLWLNSYSLLNAGFHGLSTPAVPSLSAAPNSAALVAAAAAAAANPFSAAGHYPQNLGGQNIPPVCWWNSGEGYCLKRFANAEELLQHLRTHAHESANKSSLLNSALPGPLPSVSGRLSPRSTSYLNSLNALRYHPYSKLSPTAPGSAPSSSTLPHIPFPTLNSAAAYGLQTSLFGGQRLPGSLPHP